jgi:hypothetical protein
MALKAVSASKDVIGDLSRLGTNNNIFLEPDEKKKVIGSQASFNFHRAGKKGQAMVDKGK